MRSVRRLMVIAAFAFCLRSSFCWAQSDSQAAQPAPVVNHSANFEAERRQADELFTAGKTLEALPLYEDLCKQDSTIAVFAERHGSGLIAKALTITDEKERQAVHTQGVNELLRAQSLGDNSAYVQNMLAYLTKSTLGSVLSGVPLSVAYTYQGKPEAQAVLKQGEADFARSDWTAAAEKYKQAYALDPAWYIAAVDEGDMYFRTHDVANAGIWFQKAIDIDPDCEIAYRYWGDTIVKSGDLQGAKTKYEQAAVAEPYGRPATLGLLQWAKLAHYQLVRPQVAIPEFTISDGKLSQDPLLAKETGDGHASWLVYEQTRLAQGAQMEAQWIVAGSSDASGVLHPSGYRHSLKEESASIHAMLDDVRRKLKDGSVSSDKLEPSLKSLLQIDQDGMIDCWIFLNDADAGIRADYPAYRKDHRDLLAAYIDRYKLQAAPATTADGK